jgi:hypothetical protein
MVASLSMAVAGTIHTLTPLFELTADMCVGMVFFSLMQLRNTIKSYNVE